MTENIKQLVRIVNTDIDGLKPVHQALLKIKGVGVSFSNMAISLAGVDKHVQLGALSEDQIKKLDETIRNPAAAGAPSWMLNRQRDPESNVTKHIVVADLDYVKDNDIKRLRKIKCYRGNRHSRGLPVRGQRTRSNFRRNKGKVTLGVQRKKTAGAKAAGAKADPKKK